MTNINSQKSELAQKHCKACAGDTKPFSEDEIRQYLKKVDSWDYSQGNITKTFKFKNYYRTVAFVNAVAWIAHREDHHPDIEFGYRTCRVSFRTHAIDGISENDFIAAAKVNAMMEE
jgi:4a-hydroxytetrahydrobiopterin dehydratase